MSSHQAISLRFARAIRRLGETPLLKERLMTLGAALIEELRRRRELGMYFSYSDYRRLRKIDTLPELTAFLGRAASSDPPPTANPAQLADWLRATMSLSSLPDCITWALMGEPLVGLMALLVWAGWHGRRKCE